MKLSDVPAGSNIDIEKTFDLLGSMLFTSATLAALYVGMGKVSGIVKIVKTILKKIIWAIA